MADYPIQIRVLHKQLIAIALDWAMGRPYDERSARNIRNMAIQANHRHYYECIPIYRMLADQASVSPNASVDHIIREMMSTDHIFKSYSQQFLDDNNFSAMNHWLRQIFDQPVKVATDEITSLDNWLECLQEANIFTVFSSGTSGEISFVPRDQYTWSNLTSLATSYIPLFQMRQGIVPGWKRLVAYTAAQLLPSHKFVRLIQRYGLRSYDGFFLSFSKGTQGTQVVGQVLSSMMHRSTFLFDLKLSATAVRGLVRGAVNDHEQQLVKNLLDETVNNQEKNYQNFIEKIEQSVRERKKALVFGAPFMIKEFCHWLIKTNQEVKMPPGSLLFHGGGWKSFEGDKIDEMDFLKLVTQATGIPSKSVSEGYSMTEAQVVYPRCMEGRFHIPPITETVIFDEALEPLKGDDICIGKHG